MAKNLTDQKDASRPFFNRKPGEVGIYLDPYDAVAIDPKKHGSEHFFIMHMGEALFDEMSQKVSLDVVKGAFESRNLLDGVIFDRIQKGVILVVTFDTLEAVDLLWKSYSSKKLQDVMKEVYVTDASLKRLGAVKIDLRTRMYMDEIEACKAEIHEKKVPKYSFKDKPNDILMIKKVREYQHDLADHMLVLRDDLNSFEEALSEFTMLMKRNLPNGVQAINTFSEFEKYYAPIKSKRGVNVKPFEDFIKVWRELKRMFNEMEMRLHHPLADVHMCCESNRQTSIKAHIKDVIRKTKVKYTLSYNFSKLKHPDWQSKIIHREQKLFVGLFSVVAYGIDSIVEVDQQLDEYLSGCQDIKT